MDYPVRSVSIKGIPAAVRVAAPLRTEPRRIGPIDITPQFRSVKDADDMDRVVAGGIEPEDRFVCPLCNDSLGWEAFKAHAPQCIEARAPRGRIWTPPGFSSNATQVYSDEWPAEPRRVP